MLQTSKLPRHVAIIMDGNGRWAAAQGLPRVLGHRAGAETVRRIVEAAVGIGIQALTVYAFSSENWDRPADEIRDLMGLLEEFLSLEVPNLRKQGIRLNAIGRLESLPAGPLNSLRRAIHETASGDRMTLTLALSYGGRQEIVDACRRLAEQVRAGHLKPADINEAEFARQLYTSDLPDPDLLIRTSGELRLSNFLLWQCSYTELYITPKLWPAFTKEDLLEALAEYQRRDRRFGRTASAADSPAGPARRAPAPARTSS